MMLNIFFRATGSIKINLTQVKVLADQWESEELLRFSTDLSKNSTTANAGGLLGNRMFWENDYIVHRGSNYVSSVKMISSRTSNTECINMQNPFGFHLGQGNHFTYVYGDEYEDIQASWDWNLIPGITTDYGNTPLICNFTQWGGNETFVGGASVGEGEEATGISVMKYLNPYTGAFKYKKVWFFLPNDVQHVVVTGAEISSSSPNWLPGTAGPSADVYSVLDQKRRIGDVYLDGKAISSSSLQNFTTYKSLWHNGVGYTFPSSSDANSAKHVLSVNTPTVTGNWSLIGTSASPPTTVDLFSAWIEHDPQSLGPNGVVQYSVYPGTTSKEKFDQRVAYKKDMIEKVNTDDNVVTAIVDGVDKVIMAAFWQKGSFEFPLDLFEGEDYYHKGGSPHETLVVKTNKPCLLIVDLKNVKITVSDPTQLLKGTVIITLQLKGTKKSQGSQFEGLFGESGPLLELARKKRVETRLRLPSDNFKGLSTSTVIGKRNNGH
ncbi:hypothetical protein FRC03_008504 [Tulasnella sp. 419]|nr:hypothetical protein FRC03_008504 [Tulasnella sp. 419]